MLEEALQGSTTQSMELKKRIDYLEDDNQIKQTKIKMLEELFRELNQHDRRQSAMEEQKQRQYDDDEKDNSKERRKKNKAKRITSVGRGVESSTAKSSSMKSTTEDAAAGLTLWDRFRTTKSMSSEQQQQQQHEQKPPSKLVDETTSTQPLKGVIAIPRTITATFTAGSSSSNGSAGGAAPTKMNKVKIKFKKAGLEGVYTGPLVDKKPHGVGTIRFSNGDTYLGEMKKGKMSGTGTLYTISNGVFRGKFENNRLIEHSGSPTGGTGKKVNQSSKAEKEPELQVARNDYVIHQVKGNAKLDVSDGATKTKYVPVRVQDVKDIGFDDGLSPPMTENDDVEGNMKRNVDRKGTNRVANDDDDIETVDAFGTTGIAGGVKDDESVLTEPPTNSDDTVI